MVVYRIEREKYIDTTLSGVGASLSEGVRWNSLNTRIVYTSESRALALLEVAVHLDLSEDLPNDRYLIEIEIPDDVLIHEVMLADLPKDWNAQPPSLITQVIGDDFVRYNESAILKVPSTIIPQEFNFLINPNHQDAAKLRVLNAFNMQFDSRLKLKG